MDGVNRNLLTLDDPDAFDPEVVKKLADSLPHDERARGNGEYVRPSLPEGVLPEVISISDL